MSFLSLPHYPMPQRPAAAAGTRATDRKLSPRTIRILIALTVLVGIAAVVYELRGTIATIGRRPAPAPRLPPLDFGLVVKRFADVRVLLHRREDVERLLGPPTQPGGWAPELAKWEADALHSNRHWWVPSDRVWYLWIDPKNEDRFVAVLFAGDRVYARHSKGLEPPAVP